MSSKLVQRLKSIAETAAPAMGFRPASASAKARGPLLVAVLAHADGKSAKAAIDAGTDALLARTTDASVVAELADASDGTGCGVEAGAAEGVDLGALKDAGCDFVVFSPGSAPAAWLRVEGLAKVARLTPSADMTSLRGLDCVGIDAVLLDRNADDDFVSVQFVMTGYFLVGALGKPVIAMVPSGVDAGDIGALWDAGIDAIATDGSPAKLKELHRIIAALPPRSRKKGSREVPFLPQLGGEAAFPPEEEDEGE